MFDDIIRDKANQHEAPVPPDAWDNIAKKKRKRRFAFFWWFSSLLLLGGIGAALYFNAGKLPFKNTAAGKEKEAAAPAATEPVKPLQEAASGITKNNCSSEGVVINASPADKKELTANAAGAVVTDNKINFSSNRQSVKPSSLTHTKENNYLRQNKEAIDKSIAKSTGNKRPMKKVKGKATIMGTPAETGETVTEIQEQKNKAVTVTDSSNNKNTEQKNTFSNEQPAANDSALAGKSTIAVDEKKTVTAASPETKKENSTASKKSTKQPWFIDVSAAPILSVQHYNQSVSFNRTMVSNNNLTQFSAKLVNTTIDPAVAFSLAVRKTISSKMTVGIGLQYLQLKENITVSGTETNSESNIVNRLVNGTNGPVLVNDTLQTITEGTRKIIATNSYTLFSIPIFMQCNFVQHHNWNIGAVGGLYINIASQYQNEINRNAAAPLITMEQSTNDKTKFVLDLYAGLRFGKQFGKRTELFVMPSMRWNLGHYNIKNIVISKNIHQAGLSVGVSFKVN